MRHDDGDAGADEVAVDACLLPHAHAADVGEGVQRAGLEHAGREADVAGPRPRSLGSHAGRQACSHERRRREPSPDVARDGPELVEGP